ncbi:MAG: nitroreductase family deazaflavin-dependent oxidoreductase [Acidimicrobiales bacterium]
MPLEGEYEPSPWEPISEQVALYESTDGAEGNDFLGGPCIILTSRGAKSGNLRKTPLIRVTDGTRYGLVGSMGGAPFDPQWVHNLRANPQVELQDGPVRQDYTAHQTEGDEKTEWWARATDVWPDYNEYQRSTDRVIPLFVLEPVD